MTRTTLAASAVLATLFLAGCGGGSSLSTTSTAVPSTTASAAATAVPTSSPGATPTAVATSTPNDICGYAELIASSFAHKSSNVEEQKAFASSVTAALDAIGKVVPADLQNAWQTETVPLKAFFAAEAAANYDAKTFLSSKAFQDAMTELASPAVLDASNKMQAWVATQCPNASN